MDEVQLNVIERDPAFEGIRRDRESMGIVWFDDPFPHFASEDPGEWIDGIEKKFIDGRPERKGRTPYHFYISNEGEIFEGLGWGAYSHWDQMGKNQSQPHNGSNSIAVLYLGAGETMSSAAKTAASQLVDEHRRLYPKLFRTLLYYQIFDATPNGAGGKNVSGSLKEWVRRGCIPPEIPEAGPEVIEFVAKAVKKSAAPKTAPAPRRKRK